uniref:Uncharacterized protein n=1 Tax=Strigamia maritima TaxID=126957 RepID=T1IYN7_STRMM
MSPTSSELLNDFRNSEVLIAIYLINVHSSQGSPRTVFPILQYPQIGNKIKDEAPIIEHLNVLHLLVPINSKYIVSKCCVTALRQVHYYLQVEFYKLYAEDGFPTYSTKQYLSSWLKMYDKPPIRVQYVCLRFGFQLHCSYQTDVLLDLQTRISPIILMKSEDVFLDEYTICETEFVFRLSVPPTFANESWTYIYLCELSKLVITNSQTTKISNELNFAFSLLWVCGATDNAPDYESEDCSFQKRELNKGNVKMK